MVLGYQSLLVYFSTSGTRVNIKNCTFAHDVNHQCLPFISILNFQGITNDVWWYYMLSLSFYWALLFSVFEDIKRKDFLEMMIHHIITILLLVLSWTCNLVRVGTLVLVIHDCADIFLESAKMMKYIKWQRTCDILFGIFTLTWIGTRLVMYPFWILNRYFDFFSYCTQCLASRISNCLFFFQHLLWGQENCSHVPSLLHF
jgi:hypothetical protein